MDALQAVVLQVKLSALSDRLAKRIAMANELCEIFKPYDVQVMQGCRNCKPTYSPFVVRLNRRHALMDRLRACGIDVRVHYPVTISQSAGFAEFRRDCPEARKAAEQLLSIPCCPEFTDRQWQYLKHSLRCELERIL